MQPPQRTMRLRPCDGRKKLISSRVLDLTVTVAFLDGLVLRVEGHFRAPHRILRNHGEEATGCILALLGRGGFLLEELQIYNSESGNHT